MLMDEPFSALDVLTADNLRNDLIDIWKSKKTKIKAIVLVTHNIEEAALLADRIFLFANNPGCIREVLEVHIPHPRTERNPAIRELIDQIYTLMTLPILDKTLKFKTIDVTYRLPDVGVSELTGFIETLVAPEYAGKKVGLQELAEALHFEIDDLFPITEVLEILRFAYVSQGDIELTAAGKSFADADILGRKKLFAVHLIQFVPIVQFIRHFLDHEETHEALESVFLKVLEAKLSKQAAEEVLQVVIAWGRYAEIFAYDYDTGMLSLENP